MLLIPDFRRSLADYPANSTPENSRVLAGTIVTTAYAPADLPMACHDISDIVAFMMRKLFLNLVFILPFFSLSLAGDFQRATAVHLDRSGEKWAEKALKKLSLEEKVGQMFMVRLIMPQFV